MASAPDVPLAPPERLAATVAARAGEPGRAWLAALPGLVRECLRDWELTPLRVLRPGGAASMVVLVDAPGDVPAALKLALPAPETAGEPAALERWDGRAAVRLLRADPERGALLLERLRGEVSLRSLPDAKAMLEAGAVARRLWLPAEEDGPFPTVTGRSAALAGELRDLAGLPWAREAAPLVEAALAAREELVAGGAGAPVLLHGDFHHGNVLAGARVPWLAVGPEPLVGEPAYDLARLARDRLRTLAASAAAQSLARRRLGKLADALEVDVDRLRGWALFRAVAAAGRAFAARDRERGELLLEFAGWL